MTVWVRVAVFGVLVAAYCAGTLPHLADYPPVDWTQMGVTPASHTLATTGVYGNAQFAGFHRIEAHNYEFMPLYPLAVALSFSLFGTGVLQARLVSWLCGLLTVLLTWALGRRIGSEKTGFAAAGFLCLVPMGTYEAGGGMPLFELARTIRYDVMVPVFVTAAALLFLSAATDSSGALRAAPGPRRLTLVGVLVGLSVLSHLYGGLVLAPMALFVVTIAWAARRQQRARPWLLRSLLLPAGLLAALAPWFAYVSLDLPAYRGQMARHGGRFSVTDASFYVENVGTELERYAQMLDAMSSITIGAFAFIAAIVTGVAFAFRRREPGPRFVAMACVLLPLLLALLMTSKRPAYLSLALPFFAVAAGYGVTELWEAVSSRAWAYRAALAAVAFLVVTEGVLGVGRAWWLGSQATPYDAIVADVTEPIPRGSRVLVSQALWMGMIDDYEPTSLFGIFLRGELEGLEPVIDELDPDYVVAERFFFSDDNDWMRESWDDLDRYLTAHCPERVGTVEDRTYGTFDVYRCGAADE